MHVTTEQHLNHGLLKRRFTVGDIPGILWTPPSASAAAPVPLILAGQPAVARRGRGALTSDDVAELFPAPGQSGHGLIGHASQGYFACRPS
ncbi:hypothetical protein [Nocardioides sp. LML1-1-1.1]|uniref:hypothetical protein n=1 Tax=Nocardioides sp. LML1-1-1.1 TaxID=3135248 RepID=UPI00344133D9